MCSPTFPVQSKLFITLAYTHCASGLIGDSINRCVRPHTFQQLLHTERTVVTTLAEQADVMLVYEVQLSHWHPSGGA